MNNYERFANLVPDQLLAKLQRQLDRHLGEDSVHPFKEAANELNISQLAFNKRGLPSIPKDVEDDGRALPTSRLIDDGPLFDLELLPEDMVVGDTAPSSWAAIEARNRKIKKLSSSTQAFSAAHTSARKLMAKVGMLD